MRLKELQDEGYIECINGKKPQTMVVWRLTEKGRDTLPILAQLATFGSKWYADTVFEDKRPRTLGEIFPQPEVRQMIRGLLS
jgi:DNA-binding HxlR family transcriptional regulator